MNYDILNMSIPLRRVLSSDEGVSFLLHHYTKKRPREIAKALDLMDDWLKWKGDY